MHRGAVETGHLTSGGPYDRVSGRDIPLANRAEARVEVREAFGDQSRILLEPHQALFNTTLVGTRDFEGFRDRPEAVERFAGTVDAADASLAELRRKLVEIGTRSLVVRDLERGGEWSGAELAELLDDLRRLEPMKLRLREALGSPWLVIDLIEQNQDILRALNTEKLVLFLASDRARWITGGLFPLDGGRALTSLR